MKLITYFSHGRVNEYQAMIFKVGNNYVPLWIESSSSRSCEALQIAAVIDSIEREP